MKQNNYFRKALMTVALLLGGVSFLWAAVGDPTDLPTTDGTYVTLDKSRATTSGTINNTTESTGEYGSIKEGGTLLFKLNNTVAQKYTVSMLLATNNNGSSCDVQILGSDQSTIEYSTTINIYNSGYWDHWAPYAFTTSGNVTTGDKYLKIVFHQETSDAYVCNGKQITITAGTKAGTGNIVEIPAASNNPYTFTLSEAVTYTSNASTGANLPNKKTSGTTPYYDNYSDNGMVVYALYNNTNQYYRISFHGATENATSSFTFIVLNETGAVETSSTFPISITSWTTFDETTLKSFTTSSALTTGHKTFILKFQNVNVANLTFTPTVAATQYTVTTSANPAVGGTVFGGGTYDEGSNVDITKKANWGYQFSNWTVNDAAAGNESTYTISSIAANTNIVGNFSVDDGIFQTIPTATGSYLDLMLANPDLATNGKPTSSYLDNYRSYEQTQFALRSTTAQRYAVSFKTARNNDGNTTVTFTFATKAEPKTAVFTKEMTIANNGSWTVFANTYSFYTDELAAGDWIMTLTFGNTGTTCNMKDFAIVPYQALDEATDYTATAATNATVQLTRSITANKWSTIVLPFDIASSEIETIFGSGASVAELSSGTATALNFTTTLTGSKMKANQPYAIKVSSAFSSATINGVTIESATPTQSIANWDFVGTYTNTNVPKDSYFFSDNKLYQASAAGKVSMKPFRGYFTYTGGSTEAPMLNFIIDGNLTGIAHIDADGQMNLEEGTVYNLNGQRVAQTTKGLYIVNGKKVIIK